MNPDQQAVYQLFVEALARFEEAVAEYTAASTAADYAWSSDADMACRVTAREKAELARQLREALTDAFTAQLVKQ